MNKVGIDAGGTLTKVIYNENGKRHFKTFPSKDIDSMSRWLQWLAPSSEFFVTGGKAAAVKSILNNCTEIPEFKAVCSGSAHLMGEEHERQDPFILANIGTGTSFFLVDHKKREYRRLLGTGMGGGTIMGLGKILSGKDTFNEIISLAESGNRENVDLLVSDLYDGEEPPIPGHLTAANFAGDLSNMETPNDALRSLINMIAENIILLATRAAELEGLKTIVFTGGALSGNPLLKEDLSQFADMIEYEPVFLADGVYAGAVGSLINS
ncbi:type II pantothenate kinase [Bacillus sp. SCS-153A]|uniref:type II pantothenate kinase n=1 Tax=Rossellomorea sedimentorum TaxID=3115294 RepID=UPI003905FB8D